MSGPPKKISTISNSSTTSNPKSNPELESKDRGTLYCDTNTVSYQDCDSKVDASCCLVLCCPGGECSEKGGCGCENTSCAVIEGSRGPRGVAGPSGSKGETGDSESFSPQDFSPAMWLKSDYGVTLNVNNVSQWDDLSGNGRYVSQATALNQPLLVPGALNGYPVVRFNGSHHLPFFDNVFLNNSDYSVFIVEGRRSNKVNNYYIAGNTFAANTNLVLGYRNDTQLTQAHWSNDLDSSLFAGYNIAPDSQYRVTSYLFSQSMGKAIWRNGMPIGTDFAQVNPITIFTGATLGCLDGFPGISCYEGDIVELIIFTRALTALERIQIENYLQHRYNLFNIL